MAEAPKREAVELTPEQRRELAMAASRDRMRPITLPRELTPYQSAAWYALNTEKDGAILATACRNRYDADRWHSAYIRLGDMYFKATRTGERET